VASAGEALGAAAAATSTLGVGTCVLQAGVRDPFRTAADAATLDLLAPGRVLLGLGAGHTFEEWETVGALRPSAADRTGRLVEFVTAVAGLLAGETVDLEGRFLRLVGASLDGLPTEGRVGLMVGGGNPALLRAAAAHADVVGLTGLGRTLPDGHRHDVRWSRAVLEDQLALVREESAHCGTTPRLEALVQVVTVTRDRATALDELSHSLPGTSAQALGETPYVLVGTVEQMAEQLQRQAHQWGITRYVVREPASDTLGRVLTLLR
jgi:probable F420-dependent oxidoreductase